MPNPADTPIPTVLIVGAGLGGLMLGAILENTDISYHILERATEIRPLGSAIALSGNILPAFEQLGIYEELRNASLPHISTDMFDTRLNYLGCLHAKFLKIAPNLSDILRRRVPAHKISMGKKVLRTKEHDNKVVIYCSDNTIYECSVLVGADGVYSAVRQNMYKQLEEDGNLPSRDKDAFSIGFITMVGISHPLDPAKYPELNDNNRTHFRLVIGENNDSCYVVTVPERQLCWGVQLQLPKDLAKEQHFRNSEWGPESVDSMLKQFQAFPCGFGGTMKDIFDATPRELICKVFLEEKVFQTWYHGRSVLIGDGNVVANCELVQNTLELKFWTEDNPMSFTTSSTLIACHKLLPGAGQGAVMAMKDAVVLANCIYNMRDESDKSINAAFNSYHRQRHHEADEIIKGSNIVTKIMFGHKWIDRLLRRIVGNYIPDRINQKIVNKHLSNRPQINWLPLVENRGLGYVIPQEGRKDAEKKSHSV